MKTWKLVSGILSIVLSGFVLFQSGLAGFVNSVENSSDAGGSAGLLVAILLLAGGIVSIVTRNSKSKGGNIAIIIMFGIAAILGFSNAAVYKDLMIWSVWCVLCALLALVSMLKSGSSDKTDTNA